MNYWSLIPITCGLCMSHSFGIFLPNMVKLMAVHMLGENGRLAEVFENWSSVPLWAYHVDAVDSAGVQLTAVGTQTRHLIHSLGMHPRLKEGDGILCRILPFQGFEFSGLAQLHFPEEKGWMFLKSRFLDACYELDISPGFDLTPAYNLQTWKDSSLRFIKIWRNFVYDRQVGTARGEIATPARKEIPCPSPEVMMNYLLTDSGIRQIGPNKVQLHYKHIILGEVELYQSALILHLKDEAFGDYCDSKLRSIISQAESNMSETKPKEFNSAISP